LVTDINVLGKIHLYNSFMPQILNGTMKKVACVSSAMGDLDFVNGYDIDVAPVYAASKAAVSLINAKFSAQYKRDGVLFLSVCPGMVEVGHHRNGSLYLKVVNTVTDFIFTATPEQVNGLKRMLKNFQTYAPHFKGAGPPEEAVKSILSVVEKSNVENGDGGALISHLGGKQWI
jgi:NAD(P)-dependent dehydrogenase (short-subunit alcohol dehydrogenase family)